MFIESVMSSSHLINCHLLLLLPSIFPSIRVFFSESALHIRQPKYCCISPLRLFSGHSSPVLTLRTDDVAYASLPSPHLLLADVSFWATSPLVMLVKLFFFFPGDVALWNSKFSHQPACERVSYCMETCPPSQLPPQDGSPLVPKFFVFIFVFYILSYLFLKTLACLSGCPMSSASIQKLFCGSCSTFKWSSDEFMGDKVFSLSYSSAILGLHL